VYEEATDDFSYRHVGAIGTEIEYQRYQPRSPLTRRLNEADLVQVVAGTPAWAQLCRDVERTVTLQVATLARVERETTLSNGSGPLNPWRRAMTRLTNRLDHQALQHVDVAFVENSWMEEHLNEILGEERVVFAPPGVETDQFTAGPSPSTCNYLLSVGRFADPRKNVTLLFEAYARVQDRLDEAPRLVLVGRSAPSDEARARAEALGIRSAVTFHEDVSQERLSELYRNAALYVVSSNEEGLGLTILEAMASGRPVVSTRCGGPSTAVIDGQTGVLVPKKSASTLTEALVTLLEDPTRADQMGKRGRERVEQHFSAEATGQRFLEVYDRILGGSA